MKKIVRLTESDLKRLVKRVIKEQSNQTQPDPWTEQDKWCTKDSKQETTKNGSIVKIFSPYRGNKTYLYSDFSAKDAVTNQKLYWLCIKNSGVRILDDPSDFSEMGLRHPLQHFGHPSERIKDMADKDGATIGLSFETDTDDGI